MIQCRFFLSLIVFLFTPTILFAKVPNDPLVDQWSFRDTKAFEAWDTVVGKETVVVAIIDNGFDTFHPDLHPNVWKNEDEIPDNKIDDDHNGYIDDVWGWDFVVEDKNKDGRFDITEQAGDNDPRPEIDSLTQQDIRNGIVHHGTLVAGIIGAVGNNAGDGAGLNWRVRLMNIRMLNNGGTGSLQPLSRAIRYAVDNGADVINFSIIGSGEEKELLDVINYAYGKGVVMVAAAGNDDIVLNEQPLYPICADRFDETQLILGVSAINEQHRLASFSNYGASCIDLTAPGVNIASTLRYAPRNGLSQTYGGGWNGTSFAAPFVSGAAALVKSIQPDWGPQEVFAALLSTVHKTPPPDENVYKNLFGAGLIQINRAVEYAMSQLPRGSGPLVSIHSIDKVQGVVFEKNIDDLSGLGSVGAVGLLKDIDDVVAFQGKGEIAYATVRQDQAKQRKVEFFTADWQLIASWKVSAAGPLDMEFADVTGDESPEVVVSTRYSDVQIVRIFNLNGKELAQYGIAGKHAGVSLGKVYDAQKKKSDILVGYRYQKQSYVARVSGEGILIEQFVLADVPSIGSVAGGDLDGDGIAEYVITGGTGSAPWILYYGSSGTFKRKFSGYDLGYQGGLSVILADVDGDGADDVVTTPLQGGQPVRVWNSRSKKITEWWPWEDHSTVSLLLPEYRR